MLAPEQVLLLLLDELDKLSVPYAIGGSLASCFHSEPRATHDSDVLIGLRREHVRPLSTALGRSFYVDEVGMKEAVRTAGFFNVIHLGGARKIDLYVAGDGVLDREQLARAILAPFGGRDVRFTSAELIVLRKLDWYRRNDCSSDRQLRDVVAVLRVQTGKLDDAYLDHMAGELGLTELLAKARRAAVD